jgi:hypothetical protein
MATDVRHVFARAPPHLYTVPMMTRPLSKSSAEAVRLNVVGGASATLSKSLSTRLLHTTAPLAALQQRASRPDPRGAAVSYLAMGHVCVA